MSMSHFDLMQSAVDIVGTSQHGTNKIAATFANTNEDGRFFHLSRTNYWPATIVEAFGLEARIGDASGTVHAETACLIDAEITEGGAMYVTDPPCPNCVKNLAEAGVTKLYIDHKGFDKDFAKRRGDHFDNMSMQICERAGISVYEINRKERKITPILEIAESYSPDIERPLRVDRMKDNEQASSKLFADFVCSSRNFAGSLPFALAFAQGRHKNYWVMAGEAHPAIGYTANTLEAPADKYSFILEPVNRLIMGAARRGLKIDPYYLYSSRVPTSRELVNMVGANLTKIHVGNLKDSRDQFGLQALKQLTEARILTLD